MEQVLNLIWLFVAAAACVAVLPRRHDMKALAVIIALSSLLFPIISASDDLSADRTLLDAFAAVMVGFALLFGLRIVSRASVESRQLRLLSIPVHSDPRSPPRV